MEFNFLFDNTKTTPVVHLQGELIEKSQAQNLLSEVELRINNGEKRVVLDLQELKYINSSGLNVLINILTKCRNSGGEVVVCCLSEKVKQLFLITKLNSLFTVTGTLEEALVAFKD
jgi:anti-sigma B factor antagonist